MGDVAALTWPLTGPGALLYNPSSRVRRCLFGPVDHEKAELHLEEQVDQIAEQNKLRWNFDFLNERPLPPGRYLWEKVGKTPDTDGGSSTSVQDASNAASVQDTSVSQDAEEKEKAAKKEQTHITDFMRKRKSSSTKDSVMRSPKTRRRSST